MSTRKQPVGSTGEPAPKTSPENILALVVKDVPGLRKTRHQIVRRHIEDSQWLLLSKGFGGKLRCHEGYFNKGVLIRPTFVHSAPEVYCAPRYNSTGEAEGESLFIGDFTLNDGCFKRTVAVAYDRENKKFRKKGVSKSELHTADVLILNGDGSATACWLKDAA